MAHKQGDWCVYFKAPGSGRTLTTLKSYKTKAEAQRVRKAMAAAEPHPLTHYTGFKVARCK
jgi:hypothetical protein